MRIEFRNRATKLISFGLLLIAALAVLVVFGKDRIPDVVVVVGAVLLGTFGSICYIQGCIALAEAKGYFESSVPVMITLSFFFFLPLLFFIPLFLLYGLKDRDRGR